MDFILNDYHRGITNEELLDDMKRVYLIIGKDSLNQNEYKIHGKYGLNTFRRRFGGWNQALELCGIVPTEQQIAATKSSHDHPAISTEELLEDLRMVARKLDKKTFSSQDYKNNGQFSRDVYFSRFNTWNNALSSAGLEPYHQIPGHRIDDEALFEEIERIWILLGRQPTVTDIKNGCSRYSLNAFTRRFGGWRNALTAFISWVNDESKVSPIHKSEAQIPVKPVLTTTINIPHTTHTTSRDVNLRLRFKVMRRDNFKCCFCGASPAHDPSIELHVDHIVPWSKGGETKIDNLQTLCSKCNLGKSDLTI